MTNKQKELLSILSHHLLEVYQDDGTLINNYSESIILPELEKEDIDFLKSLTLDKDVINKIDEDEWYTCVYCGKDTRNDKDRKNTLIGTYHLDCYYSF